MLESEVVTVIVVSVVVEVVTVRVVSVVVGRRVVLGSTFCTCGVLPLRAWIIGQESFEDSTKENTNKSLAQCFVIDIRCTYCQNKP